MVDMLVFLLEIPLCPGAGSYLYVCRPAQVVVCRADHVAISLHQTQLLLFRQVVQFLLVRLAIFAIIRRAVCVALVSLALDALNRDLVCFPPPFCEALGREGPYSEL